MMHGIARVGKSGILWQAAVVFSQCLPGGEIVKQFFVAGRALGVELLCGREVLARVPIIVVAISLRYTDGTAKITITALNASLRNGLARSILVHNVRTEGELRVPGLGTLIRTDNVLSTVGEDIVIDRNQLPLLGRSEGDAYAVHNPLYQIILCANRPPPLPT